MDLSADGLLLSNVFLHSMLCLSVLTELYGSLLVTLTLEIRLYDEIRLMLPT